MTRPRVIETNEGIQSEVTAAVFDVFARQMRDKGWNGVAEMLAADIPAGDILELGPGPGYVGLELAKRLQPKSLTGCEISPAMLRLAEKNAAEYRIKAKYTRGNVMELPFGDGSFDGVISNGSMHEWEDPVQVFDEVYRVLRPGGRYCITDLRRDVPAWKRWMVYRSTKPKEIRPGLISSLNAAYTREELCGLLERSALRGAAAADNFFGVCIVGVK